MFKPSASAMRSLMRYIDFHIRLSLEGTVNPNVAYFQLSICGSCTHIQSSSILEVLVSHRSAANVEFLRFYAPSPRSKYCTSFVDLS